jgi:hypothetical protein
MTDQFSSPTRRSRLTAGSHGQRGGHVRTSHLIFAFLLLAAPALAQFDTTSKVGASFVWGQRYVAVLDAGGGGFTSYTTDGPFNPFTPLDHVLFPFDGFAQPNSGIYFQPGNNWSFHVGGNRIFQYQHDPDSGSTFRGAFAPPIFHTWPNSALGPRLGVTAGWNNVWPYVFSVLPSGTGGAGDLVVLEADGTENPAWVDISRDFLMDQTFDPNNAPIAAHSSGVFAGTPMVAVKKSRDVVSVVLFDGVTWWQADSPPLDAAIGNSIAIAPTSVSRPVAPGITGFEWIVVVDTEGDLHEIEVEYCLPCGPKPVLGIHGWINLGHPQAGPFDASTDSVGANVDFDGSRWVQTLYGRSGVNVFLRDVLADGSLVQTDGWRGINTPRSWPPGEFLGLQTAISLFTNFWPAPNALYGFCKTEAVQLCELTNTVEQRNYSWRFFP